MEDNRFFRQKTEPQVSKQQLQIDWQQKKQNVSLTDQQKTVCNIFEDFGLNSEALTEEVGFEEVEQENR